MEAYHSLYATEMPDGQGDVPPMGFAIAQLKGIYILAENTQGLIIVDMHAAHERITYERMKTAFDNQGLVSQPLLVPESLSVSEREAEIADKSSQIFAQLGFVVETSRRREYYCARNSGHIARLRSGRAVARCDLRSADAWHIRAYQAAYQ